jgi:phosphoribosyl-AMP cyclohydrolase
MDHAAFLGLVRYGADGLAPCVVQAAASREVLMVAWANDAALRATLSSGEAHFWSRSRQELWHKGGTSGNVQRVVSARLDCDHDTVLLTVEPAGPACHTGAVSCFRDEASGGAATTPAAGDG